MKKLLSKFKRDPKQGAAGELSKREEYFWMLLAGLVLFVPGLVLTVFGQHAIRLWHYAAPRWRKRFVK